MNPSNKQQLFLGRDREENEQTSLSLVNSRASLLSHIGPPSKSLEDKAASPGMMQTSMADESAAIEELMSKLHMSQIKKSRTTSAHDSVHGSEDSGSGPHESLAANPGDEDSPEIRRLKKQLELTNERMAQMDLEINQFRLAQSTVEAAIGSPFPAHQDLGFRPSLVSSHSLHESPTATLGMLGQLRDGRAQRVEFKNDPPAIHSSVSCSSFGRTPHLEQVARLPGITPPVTPFQQPPSYVTAFQHNQAPIGTRLSPTATEFTAWQPMAAQPASQQQMTYMSTAEPLNYRRLLDRDMSCDWKYIVDKIVCSNDQQASIFLQQKLKVGTAEHKYGIVQAIIDQAYPLMVNRFGNFLVQRCFEHSTVEQIIAIAQSIRGNTLNLSMDPFGCHVVQKAFDYVPEEYKAIMVHELLRRIPETVIHRYACHVWQKLFELRWSDSPPQIMRYVNEALAGMWHEVALGETGSLVVQNIFENCLGEDKRPCIDEVLNHIDIVAHGQFGNWCIQHICEHGSVPDRTYAIDHVILFAVEYSVDQFASKVVEKCLKVGGNDFLDRYLARVCETRPDRPRMALVDIASDQFGNYLIHFILSTADNQRREIVAAHIRKHMVSLRGSKYGSRVAMLCCSPYRNELATPSFGQDRFRGGYYTETGRPVDRGFTAASRVPRPYMPYR